MLAGFPRSKGGPSPGGSASAGDAGTVWMNHPSKSLWTGIFILDLSRVQKDNNLGTYLCAAREDRFFSAVRNRLDALRHA